MSAERSVIVRRLPKNLDLAQMHLFLREIEPVLKSDRQQLVFDLSEVRRMGSGGVDLLLHCMEEVMKGNGDIKLAAISPQAAVILELTGVDRLFEVFDNAADAIESFYQFSAHASGKSWHPWAVTSSVETKQAA
jgi:anti-sigma B factor antagonist